MRVQPKIIKMFSLLVTMLIVSSVTAGSTESSKSKKSDLEARAAEIKTDATVAMDISLNALSNVIATFNDTEKAITVKLHAGNAIDIKSMVESLSDAWHSEEDVLKKIEKISTYVSLATSALSNVEMQLKATTASSSNKSRLKKAEKSVKSARKNVNKASAIAEKLKQTWLVVPLEQKTSEKE